MTTIAPEKIEVGKSLLGQSVGSPGTELEFAL